MEGTRYRVEYRKHGDESTYRSPDTHKTAGDAWRFICNSFRCGLSYLAIATETNGHIVDIDVLIK
jgi:hypothetical protein